MIEEKLQSKHLFTDVHSSRGTITTLIKISVDFSFFKAWTIKWVIMACFRVFIFAIPKACNCGKN